jgi:hypothetical protein
MGGIGGGGESLPFYNLIQPVCEYKIAAVAMHQMAIHYAPLSIGTNRRRCACAGF